MAGVERPNMAGEGGVSSEAPKLIIANASGAITETRSVRPAETPTQPESRSIFQRITDHLSTLNRNLRSFTGEERNRAEAQILNLGSQVDRIMYEAETEGMFGGLDLELDHIHQRVFSHHQPSIRFRELEIVRKEMGERFKELTDRFQDENSDEQVEGYLGVQEYYLRKGLSRIESSIRGGAQLEPEKGWEWKLSKINQRRLEYELATRQNQETSQTEQKELDRAANLEQFIRLKNLVFFSQGQIERYIRDRYQTDLNFLSKDQQKELQTRIQNTPAKLRQIGDAAWRSFQVAENLRNYAQARRTLDEIESLPEDQQLAAYQRAQNVIAQTTQEQRQIVDEILNRSIEVRTDEGHLLISKDYTIGSTVEFFIKELLSREEVKLVRLAFNVIKQEEVRGIDQTDYFQLNEACKYVESRMPEALRMGVLDPSLKESMLKLYADYRQKFIGDKEDKLEPDFRSNLKVLANKMMSEEEEWWDDNMKKRGYTQEFRERYEGVRSFYIYRGIQRILEMLERKSDHIALDPKSKELVLKQMSDTTEDMDREEIELVENRDKRQKELDQRLASGQITQQEYETRMQMVHDLYLKEISKFLRRRLIPGEFNLENAERDIRDQNERRKALETYWDRSWGTVYLTGRTPDEIRTGVRNFLKVTTSSETNFDPQRLIEDGTRLGQEILNKGRRAGMEDEELNELVAEAEGTLFVEVARYFAVRWNVAEWHQIAGLIGRHIDTRLNVLSKAFDAKTMFAAHILDSDDDYDKFSRPARFASEVSSWNDETAKAERDKTQRRLEVRVAFSRLKDINKVIKEHFAGIESVIDSFGFSRNGDIPANELFKNPRYLAAIDRIDVKLQALNKKYAQKQPVSEADKLTDEEKRLLTLDRIRPYRRTKDLVVTDQTEQQFTSLYTEGEKDFNDSIKGIKDTMGEDQYKQNVKNLLDRMAKIQVEIDQRRTAPRTELEGLLKLSDQDRKILQYELLQKYIEGGKWLAIEEAFIGGIMREERGGEVIKVWDEAKAAVDLAIKTRDVFFVSAEKACASLKTRHNIEGKGEGELLSYNDVLRFNKFVRDRALASLPADKAQAITSFTRSGQGLMYVDIADKLEFRAIAQRTLKDKTVNSTEGRNAQEALNLIGFTEEEKKYTEYVQVVEYVQDQVLEKLKEKGSSITVSDIDGVIRQVFQSKQIDFTARQADRIQQQQSVHRGETQIRSSASYHDIANREDADPQYNFSMVDDQKYSSLLLSDEIKAAAYNPDHPYYLSIPAKTLRVLDPDGTKLVRRSDKVNAEQERRNLIMLMERQRRFHFAVDSPKVFGAWYTPDPYSDNTVNSEIVTNIRNSPFIARRMIEQRVWTLWNRGQAYRGRGFLKYLESNFRGLDHSVGGRGLRESTAAYNGFSPKGFGYSVDFSGSLDQLATEMWLDKAKQADALRPILVGGQVGQDPQFEGIFKKIVKTIGRNNPGIEEELSEQSRAGKYPPLYRISVKQWNFMKPAEYEKAIDEMEDRWGRVTTYAQGLGFVGNLTHMPLAAKFSGDTAVSRIAYWAVAHPEAAQIYNVNMDLIRTILEPLGKDWSRAYFGPYSTLLSELLRRAILAK